MWQQSNMGMSAMSICLSLENQGRYGVEEHAANANAAADEPVVEHKPCLCACEHTSIVMYYEKYLLLTRAL